VGGASVTADSVNLHRIGRVDAVRPHTGQPFLGDTGIQVPGHGHEPYFAAVPVKATHDQRVGQVIAVDAGYQEVGAGGGPQQTSGIVRRRFRDVLGTGFGAGFLCDRDGRGNRRGYGQAVAGGYQIQGDGQGYH
jgi:hypothetical protein